MTYRLTLAALAALVLAAPAAALNDRVYPYTILDQYCTDSFDTPAAVAAPDMAPGELKNPPPVQTTGSPDTFCDSDSRIAKKTYTSDTDVGAWIFLPPGMNCIYVTAIASGTNGDQKWGVIVKRHVPPLDIADPVDQTGDFTGNVIADFGMGYGTTLSPNVNETLNAPLPNPFRFAVDLRGTTTTMGLSLSWAPCRGF